MKKYNVGIVGIGAVGAEMVKVLRQRNFPINELRVLARSERDEDIAGETVHVVEACAEALDGLDFAFFAGTEGAKGASQQLGWEAVKRGAIVIDNGDDFRMDPRVPLVIPEVNPEALDNHIGIIANPNCSTIIALTVLGPLHTAVGIRRFVACTYQAVSGAGAKAIAELENQTREIICQGKKNVKCEVFPVQIAFNVIPHIDIFLDNGYTKEEMKMVNETRKIFNDDRIQVSATAVRVPVFTSHSEISKY